MIGFLLMALAAIVGIFVLKILLDFAEIKQPLREIILLIAALIAIILLIQRFGVL